MPYPKHEDPDLLDHPARSPYNFVPLPDAAVTLAESEIPPQDRYSGYTGYIDCRLITLSPLYTRSGMTPDFYKQKGDKSFHELSNEDKNRRAAFFYIDDQNRPVIPGSSLRGMIRAVIEIVSYSKLHRVTNQRLIYRAVGDPTSLGDSYREELLGTNRTTLPNIDLDYPSPRVRGGYLIRHNGQRAIRPAKMHQNETFVHVDYQLARPITGTCPPGKQATYDVYVAPAMRSPSFRGKRGRGNLTLRYALTTNIQSRTPGKAAPAAGMVEATLVQSNHMGRIPPRPGDHPKHMHCAIYAPDTSAHPILISDEMWAEYVEDRAIPRGQNTATRPLQDPDDTPTKEDAVFYVVDNAGTLRFFGPTMMFRLPYRNTPLKYVPEQLRDPEHIDLSESIFGFVPEGNRASSRAGRVFFEDAHLKQGQTDIWLTQNPITPKVLSSPKPTTFQHYLVQGHSYNYNDLPGHNNRELSHFASPTPQETVIRGHKRYWHRGSITRAQIEEVNQHAIAQMPKQYTRIQPVNAGVEFTSRIYFENLTEVELGALLWVLRLSDEDQSHYAHSLGMGKPLGMGALQIRPTLHLTDRPSRYRTLFTTVDGRTTWFEGDALDGEAKTNACLAAFERFVLNNMDDGERGNAIRLSDVDRIRALLAMLAWRGPDPRTTRYMSVMPYNEFRYRPVLPDPLHVDPDFVAPAPPYVDLQIQRAPIPDEAPNAPEPPVQPPVRPPIPPLEQAVDPASLRPGTVFDAQVEKVGYDRLSLLLASGEHADVLFRNLTPRPANYTEAAERYPEGMIIQVTFRKRDKRGRPEVTLP